MLEINNEPSPICSEASRNGTYPETHRPVYKEVTTRYEQSPSASTITVLTLEYVSKSLKK